MNKQKFLESSINDFTNVYYGKDRCCRCGCRGEYISTSFMSNPRSPVDDDKFNKRLKRAKKLINDGARVEELSNCINITYGNNLALTFYID